MGRVNVCVEGGGLQLDPVAKAACDGMSLSEMGPRPYRRLWDIGKLAENCPQNRKSTAGDFQPPAKGGACVGATLLRACVAPSASDTR
jgi:hypothetical protein